MDTYRKGIGGLNLGNMHVLGETWELYSMPEPSVLIHILKPTELV